MRNRFIYFNPNERQPYMLKSNIEIVGSSWNIHLTGSPSELSQGVNVLFNWGIISKTPDDYNESNDTFVVVQSDRKRFLRGSLLATLADMGYEHRIARRLPSVLMRAIVATAHNIKQSFITEELETA